MRIEGKEDTQEEHPHVIPGVEKPQRNEIIMDRNGKHKNNTRSSTKIVNHVTIFKNAPKMFKIDVAEKIQHT